MQRPLASNADELDTLFGRFVSKYACVGASNIERFAERFCETFGLSEFPRDPRLYLPLFGIKMETDDLAPRGAGGMDSLWQSLPHFPFAPPRRSPGAGFVA